MARCIYFIMALLLLSCSSIAQQPATAHASASASIVSPVGTTKQSEMNFGSFSAPGAPGEIILSPFSQRVAVGGVKIINDEQNVKAASFIIYSSNYEFDINLPLECLMVRNEGSEVMRMCLFNVATVSGPHKTQAATLAIGATLQVNAHQVPGIYAPSTPFDVVVSYN